MDTTCVILITLKENQNKLEGSDGIAGLDEQPESEGCVMEYIKQMTVFDGKKNDWLQFAKQQAEFYANAEQYIINLQIRLEDLDEEIERVLIEVENASYNVAQGYNVYRRLKELRSAKKSLQQELEALYILTYGIDCAKEADNMKACVHELAGLYGETAGEESIITEESGDDGKCDEMITLGVHEVVLAG